MKRMEKTVFHHVILHACLELALNHPPAHVMRDTVVLLVKRKVVLGEDGVLIVLWSASADTMEDVILQMVCVNAVRVFTVPFASICAVITLMVETVQKSVIAAKVSFAITLVDNV